MEECKVLLDVDKDNQSKSFKSSNRMKILLQQPTFDFDPCLENICEDCTEVKMEEGEEELFCFFCIKYSNIRFS